MQLGVLVLVAVLVLFLIAVKFVADILERFEAGRDKGHMREDSPRGHAGARSYT